jgi:hypothetical protein
MFREAEEWFELTDDGWFFSFENICAVLGFDPDYIRRGLRVWRTRALERPGTEIALTDRRAALQRASGE